MFFQASNYTGNNHHMHVSAFGMILGFKLASHLANPDKFVTGKTFQDTSALSASYTAPSSDISARNAWYFLSTAVVAGPAGRATGADMAPAGLASLGAGLTALHRHQHCTGCLLRRTAVYKVL